MTPIPVGHVLRANIRGFTIDSSIPESSAPVFGAFVMAEIQQGKAHVIGLVYNVRIPDDPFVRQLAQRQGDDQASASSQLENRAALVEMDVVAVGYRKGGRIRHGLPPQPPIALERIVLCSDDAVRAFTQRLHFLRLLLNSPDVPADDLAVSCLRLAAKSRPKDERGEFLLRAGREMSRLLRTDLLRLEALLERLGAQ